MRAQIVLGWPHTNSRLQGLVSAEPEDPPTDREVVLNLGRGKQANRSRLIKSNGGWRFVPPRRRISQTGHLDRRTYLTNFTAEGPARPGEISLVMKNRTCKFTALAACIALSESAMGDYDGSRGDLLAGSLEFRTPERVAVALSWGENVTSRVIETQTMLIRHKATEYQRRVAERNAKAFFTRLTPAKKLELKKKHIQAVLIPTVRSAQTAPEAKDVRMRYSLEGESLIDDYAYEFQMPLQAGTIAKAQGLEPEYVGQ